MYSYGPCNLLRRKKANKLKKQHVNKILDHILMDTGLRDRCMGKVEYYWRNVSKYLLKVMKN
jgi:hypothetical protein